MRKLGMSTFFERLEKYGKYTTHVFIRRHIYLRYMKDRDILNAKLVAGILNGCPNIEDFIFWQLPRWPEGDVNWTAPGTLSKLKRLSTHYTHIVKEKGVLSDACVNVTHLWLLYMDDEWDKMAELKFRNLTHLRISRSFYYKETGLLDFVAQKDAGPCPLQVIMLSSMNGPYELWDDPRFVFLEGLPGCDMEESEDWYDSAHGAMDLW